MRCTIDDFDIELTIFISSLCFIKILIFTMLNSTVAERTPSYRFIWIAMWINYWKGALKVSIIRCNHHYVRIFSIERFFKLRCEWHEIRKWFYQFNMGNINNQCSEQRSNDESQVHSNIHFNRSKYKIKVVIKWNFVNTNEKLSIGSINFLNVKGKNYTTLILAHDCHRRRNRSEDNTCEIKKYWWNLKNNMIH